MKLEISQLDRKYEALRIQNPAQLGQLVSSLTKHGQKHPVLVVAAGGDRYVLIDGYRRAAALGVLGRDLIEAAVLAASETEALVMSQKLHGRRRLCALEQGWFLRELVCGHGLERTELAHLLERSPSWVSRRLALVDVLPEPAQQAVRRGQLSPHAAMKVLVPLARANASACIKLVERLGPEPWSVRQMERLYRDWRRGDREARERIVSHPELYRKVRRAAQRPRR